MKQGVAILGSTGSIGVSTLDVISRHPERFEVFALTAASNLNVLVKQCVQFSPRYAVLARPELEDDLVHQLRAAGSATRVLTGPQALVDVARHEHVDIVMAAIVGAAGLAPCIAAARAGKRLLLANKEALVVGGELFMDAVRQGGATLLPIDSEHSAIFQSLPDDPGSWRRRVDRIILTASGGPFRTRDPDTLHTVSPEEACAHPNWAMGRKISVDSATMMNKGLELIEAHYLFGMTPDKLEVVIHPQSVIHSMVQFLDHSLVAQLGTPDMRVPIAYGLSWPERMASGAAALDFRRLAALSFESIEDADHVKRYPALRLACDALRAPAGCTVILNAANEVSVQAFLERRIRYDQIQIINERTLQRLDPERPRSLDDLLSLDTRARALATQTIGQV